MPRFVTISPTHIPGKKRDAWEKMKTGGYIAIGWLNQELKGKSIAEIEKIIKQRAFDNEDAAISAFHKFFDLKVGDYVAVNNTNKGLFGVGEIVSDYRFSKDAHDTGAEDKDEFYSNLRNVKWLHTEYATRKELMRESEKSWVPYGTVGKILPSVPPYIRRLLGEEKPAPEPTKLPKMPDWLNPIVRSIELLRKDKRHQERAHESLVEDFLVTLGYRKHEDIRFRQGRVDITISIGGRPAALVEVKRDWDFDEGGRDGAVKQGYVYAHERGIRYVIVSNGDAYAIFDRLKGLSYESNFVGEFRLTALDNESLEVVERLRKENLERTNLVELFRNIGEAFSPSVEEE